MITPESVPRRSPRGHADSYPRRQAPRDRSDSVRNGSSARALQALQVEPSQKSSEPSTPELDLQGLAEISKMDDDYPLPPPPLSYNPVVINELENSASPSPAPSSDATTTQLPSTYAGTTQPPSTYAGATHPPPTYAETTQPPSACAPTIQEPSLNAPAIQPSPSYPRGTSPVPSQTNLDRRVEGTAVPQGSVEFNPAEAEKQKDLHHLFVHLNRLTVSQQKSMASAFGVVQVWNKKARAARLFVVISGMMDRMKRTAIELLEEKGLEKGKDFKTQFERTVQRWGEKEEGIFIPPIADLEAQGGVLQHPPPHQQLEPSIDDELDVDEVPDNSPRGDNVSLEEFARLMIIFRDVPEAAQDLRRSGQDLQRQELDLHANRNAFWTDRIERLFNDPSLLTFERLDGDLQHIDPGRPVTTFRSGFCLQNLFNKFRKEFTVIYNRWNVSGNLDPSSFVNFCRLPHQTTLTRAGARCMIAFRVFRIGTAQENTLILDFGSKEMAGAAEAQLESGIVPSNENGSSLKRRRSHTNSNIDEAIVNVLTSISKDGESVNKKRKEDVELDALAVQNARLENERKMMSNLVEAHTLAGQLQPNSALDNRVVGILQSYYGRLADEMENHVSARGP